LWVYATCIARGGYAQPVDRVRLSDVAKKAGVHTATASRALNPAARHEVNAETVRRVEQAARRLGYVPNTLARGLRMSRSFVVALVVPDITNALFPPIVRGAERVLARAGYTLVLTDTNNDPDTERSQISAMRARGVDGFIVATARWVDPVVSELAETGIPTVLVNRRDAAGALPYVGGDDRHGMQLCVDHLAGLGHSAIVHLAGPNNTSTGRERTAAFRTALRGQGVPSAGSVLECAAYTEEAGATATHTLLDKGVRFTALVAANDLLAIGALEALAGRSLRCPDDVSVTGYNDISFVSRLTPPLTTVGVPLHLMGELAAGELLDWIANPDNHQAVQTLLPVGFMLRGTTAAVSQVKSAARRGGGSRDSAAR
jgi:LacI family transcriptional regulator